MDVVETLFAIDDDGVRIKAVNSEYRHEICALSMSGLDQSNAPISVHRVCPVQPGTSAHLL